MTQSHAVARSYDEFGVVSFSGAQKAAALLLAIGKPPATRLLKHLNPAELLEVTKAAAALGSVPMSTLSSLVEEFSSSLSIGANLLGDAGHAKELLSDAVTAEQVANILSDALGTSEINVWEALAAVPPARVGDYIAAEHPLTVALILSKFDAEANGRIIPLLPRALRNDVFCHLISPPAVSEMALRVIEDALSENLLHSSNNAAAENNHSRVAQLINGLDPIESADVMKRLFDMRPRDAAILRSLLFSFEELPRLSARALALLFDKISTDTVVLALRGMDNEFRNVALSSMASRARRLVESELNSGASVSATDIANARKRIVEEVLAMARRSEIEIVPVDDAAATSV